MESGYDRWGTGVMWGGTVGDGWGGSNREA